MLIVLLIACIPVLLGLITQRLRPEISLLAASLALGWYLLVVAITQIGPNWDIFLQWHTATGGPEMDPEALSLTLTLVYITSSMTTGCLAVGAAITALLSVLGCLTLPRLLRGGLWLFHAAGVLSIASQFALSEGFEAGLGTGSGDEGRVLMSVLSFMAYKLIGTYMPLAFLACCVACILLRLSQIFKTPQAAT